MAPGGSISVVDDVDGRGGLLNDVGNVDDMMITIAYTAMPTFMMTAMTTIMMTAMTSLPSHASYVESVSGSSSAHLCPPSPRSCSCPQLLF